MVLSSCASATIVCDRVAATSTCSPVAPEVTKVTVAPPRPTVEPGVGFRVNVIVPVAGKKVWGVKPGVHGAPPSSQAPTCMGPAP